MTTTPKLAVLFADVSGSTRLYERLGDQRALALIEKTVSIMSGVTRRLRGRVVKTIGDEVMAVFADSDSACQAAIEMQTSVCNMPESIEHGLMIHCGFHWGEVMIADQDVFGDTVNVAARLASLSKSGQIVTSGDALAAIPPGSNIGTRFIDSETVKGRVTPLELYEVLWEPDVELTELAGPASRRASARRSVALVVRYAGKEYRVDDERPTLTFGRDPRADIPVSDKLASRAHGKIEKARDKFTYTDNSSNGSFVQVGSEAEVQIRRESIALRERGTISFGRPVKVEPEAALAFEIVSVG